MGFLDHAWAISLQKDNLRARIRLDPRLQQPTLTRDDCGFGITLPVPSVSEEGKTSFLGYDFQDEFGKIKAGRLFRAAVFHLTAHTTIDDEIAVMLTPRSLADIFSEALINDVYVNTYISASHADSLTDIAFANALAFENMKTLERIFNPSTRIMAALLMKVNVGSLKGKISADEGSIVAKLISEIDALKRETAMWVAGKKNELGEVFRETVREVARTLECNGPVLEAPSLPHTEQIGPCTVFTKLKAPSETQVEKTFRKVFEALGKQPPLEDSIELCWKNETNMETLQAFDSWLHQRTREHRILARIQKYTEGTRLKIVEFPEEDYTQYLRARMLLRGGSRRLLDSLRVAQDALDEDPRKEQGQLDLTEVIQKIASNSPRTDVFVENEYLSKSFAWGILFDASASMEVRGEISRALAICVAEATNELLMDPNSWSFYAFNDSLYVLKDASEAYSHRVRARIGGLRFRGLTYMPDAMRVAGKILGQRFDEQRFLIVLSDGWPYGYPDMPTELSAVVTSLQKKGIVVIGVGVESERMNEFFKESCSVYDQKDLIKKFSNIYVKASATALET